MANLPESSTFDSGVYQIETTDPVIGGPSGVSNTPLKNLANRTKYLKDHVDALESTRAPLASPALTGTPTAPTAAAGTNTTQVATTAFVKSAVDSVDLTVFAPKASPAFTGAPTAPTAAQGTNSALIATTAFVNAEIAADAAPIGHVGAAGSAHGLATSSVHGFMSSADKSALDGILTGFNSSLANSGYQKLPSGLILQWGRKLANYVGGTVGNFSYTDIQFPISFPNAVYIVTGIGTQYVASEEGSEMNIGCTSKSLSGATMLATRVTGSTLNEQWYIEFFAIGK